MTTAPGLSRAAFNSVKTAHSASTERVGRGKEPGGKKTEVVFSIIFSDKKMLQCWLCWHFLNMF